MGFSIAVDEADLTAAGGADADDDVPLGAAAGGGTADWLDWDWLATKLSTSSFSTRPLGPAGPVRNPQRSKR